MSSRKMSLSGWRATLVSAPSSTYREPALGPRLTTSMPSPSGSSSTATWTSAVGSSPPVSGVTMVIVVVSSSLDPSRAAPHDRQKFDPGALRCPHWLQNTVITLVGLFGDELPIGGRVEQPVVGIRIAG